MPSPVTFQNSYDKYDYYGIICFMWGFFFVFFLIFQNVRLSQLRIRKNAPESPTPPLLHKKAKREKEREQERARESEREREREREREMREIMFVCVCVCVCVCVNE